MIATAGNAKTEEASPVTTARVLVFVSAFVTLIWSIFTPPHKTYAARVLLFQPAWLVRAYLADSTWIQDLVIFLILHLFQGYSGGAWTFPDVRQIDLSSHELHVYIQIFSLLGGCGALAGGIVHREHHIHSSEQVERPRSETIDEQLLPSLLIQSRTTHTRIFPKKHDFSYSYLFVGIPVGIRGRVSTALSVDCNESSWFHISSADFLDRSDRHLSLGEKLKRYLHTQGVTDRDYAFAYLVTAPRLFSYSFNPVSFWYLYDSEAKLKYMILEVNNTFDERRMYLLKASSSKHDSGVDFSSDDQTKITTFTQVFDKDFHVSPFNSRKGSYSLRATDPLAAYEETGQVKIDNTVVLRSLKDSAKIVARVFSEGAPRDAVKISRFDLARFIASWCWVGFATFPRIVWQARKLFFLRKLHVWYRPEVAASSVGRSFTGDERQLESFFGAWLENVVNNAKKPLKVVYEPAHSEGQEIVMFSRGFTFEDDQQRTLTLRVLTPAFYSRFVHYAHAAEAFDRECLATHEKNRTISIKNTKLLPELLNTIKSTRPIQHSERSLLDQIRWVCLRLLRCHPPDAIYPHHSNEDAEYRLSDIRSFGYSEHDEYVKDQSEDASAYRRIVTKLFLARRFAIGIPALISALDWVFRGLLMLVTMYLAKNIDSIDVLRLRRYDTKDVWTFAGLTMLANAVHIWSVLKG